MQIGYFKTIQTNDFIDIEDVSNCAIEAYTDEGRIYALVIKTNYGMCEIFEYGPIILESPIPPKSVFCSYKTIDYDENRVVKVIEDFLNNPKKEITQAIEMDKEEVLDHCKSIIDFMRKDNF